MKDQKQRDGKESKGKSSKGEEKPDDAQPATNAGPEIPPTSPGEIPSPGRNNEDEEDEGG